MQKHPTSGNEKLNYNPGMLQQEWNNIAVRFVGLVTGGWSNEKILDLINYIKKSKYASELYPGSSLGNLLISKPENGKLNFQRTLSIATSMNRKEFILKYSDWDVIENKSDNPILWKTECGPEELIEKFNEFLKWNKNWC